MVCRITLNRILQSNSPQTQTSEHTCEWHNERRNATSSVERIQAAGPASSRVSMSMEHTWCIQYCPLDCRCTPGIIQRYLGKISGPLLDRIDIHIEVPAVA